MKVIKHIKLEQARVGQTLAAEVCDAPGNILMAADTVLDTTMLNRLRERGIEILAVWEQCSLNEAEIAAQQAVLEERLAQRFRQVQDVADMRQLHDLLLAYRVEGFERQGMDAVLASASVNNGGDEAST